jgi:hypothetical protein
MNVRRHNRSHGAALLEVVLALTLLAGATAVIGGSLSAGIRAAGGLRSQAQAADLAVTLASELQMGVVEPVSQGPTAYDAPLDGWTWEVTAVPLETQDTQPATLQRVDVIIRRESPKATYRLSQWLPLPGTEPADDSTTQADADGDFP